MESDFKVDKYGGEYRIVEGQEMHAIWLPLTLADKEAMMAKATAKGVPIGILVANFLQEWLKGKESAELSVEDLEKVVGGLDAVALVPGLYPNTVVTTAARAQIQPQRIIPPGGGKMSTVMCPW